MKQLVKLKVGRVAFVSVIFVASKLVAGCSSMIDKLKNVGNAPAFHEVNVKDQEKNNNAAKAQLIAHPQVLVVDSDVKSVNSLWRPGSRTFFRDQRARAVGDIVKVKINIQDRAKLDNKTDKSRAADSNMGIPNFFGLEKSINSKKLIGTSSSDTSSGHGKIDRKEDMTTTIAATVVRILPSGNLLIQGSQEIRVNLELREVTINGIVRPEDISSDNAINLDQIAEARLSYGGRGQISDYQQDRYGKQVLDIISPF